MSAGRSSDGSRPAFATVSSAEFLPRARVLASALARLHPDCPRFLALADHADSAWARDAGPFTAILPFASLEVPDLARALFRYRTMELTVLAKEWILRYLLEHGHDHVLFLDADTYPVAPLDTLLEPLRRHDLLLTPHHLGPLAGTDRAERERRVLQGGTFNAGVLGASRREPVMAFLSWWRERMRLRCERSPGRGLLHDQRWVDYAPAFVERVAIVRDPGVNVAYWNLPERPIERVDGRFTAAGAPLRLLHFSGFDPSTPKVLSRHAETTGVDLGTCAELLARYVEELRAAAGGAESETPWTRFDDGTPIPDLARDLYRHLGDDVGGFGDPFATGGPSSFFAWLLAPEPDDLDRERPIPRLWRAVLRSRDDLLAAFPDPLNRDRSRFLDWTRASGLAEHAIPAAFLAPSER